MLTQVDMVQADGSEEVVLSLPILGASPKSSLLIQKITGLNPPDVTLFIGDYARDGGIYQGRRVGERNPVITLALNPNPALGETASSIRDRLYKIFLSPITDDNSIKFNLIDDVNPVRYFIGQVEKFENELFDQVIDPQISIICPDPYIRDNEPTVMTDEVGWVSLPVTYNGNARTGFEVLIKINTATDALTLETNGKSMVLNRSFSVGDIVRINTNAGSRAVTVLHDPDPETSIVAALTPTSTWLEMRPYNTAIQVNSEATITSLTFTQSYWGI